MFKNKRFIWFTIVIVSSTVSMRIVNNMIVTTIPLFSKYELNFYNDEIGILTSLTFLMTLISTSLINPRMNARLRKIIYILSSFLIILILLMIFYSNGITIWIFSLIAGFSYGLITPNIITSASMVDDKLLAERLLAIYSLSLSLSLVLGPYLETYLLNFYNYRYIFLLFTPLAIPLFIFSFYSNFPEEKNEKYRLNEINKNSLFSAVINVMIYNIPFSIITVYASIYVIEIFHLSRSISYSVFIPFFTVSFFTRLYMAIKPFKNLRIAISISTFLTVIGIIFLSFPFNIYTIFISMALLGIPHGTMYPISTIIISRSTKIEERNSINSYFVSFGNLIMVIVPPLYGYLFNYFGYKLMIATLIIPVIIFYLILYMKYFNESYMLNR
ncbi:MAG: MFS transporter [Thermoplasmata archaeon]